MGIASPWLRLCLPAVLLGSGLACRTPLGSDRHDIEGFRIVAMKVDPPGAAPGEPVRARALLSVEGRLWADELPLLEWSWLDPTDPEGALIEGPVVEATGSQPELIWPEVEGRAWLGLVATSPKGEVERALIGLEPSAEALPPIAELELERLPLELGELSGEELGVEAREQLVGEPAEKLQPGELGRLRAVVEQPPADALARWMSVGEVGTWLELDPWVADLVAGELELDEEELLRREAAEPGWVTVVVLALDGSGASTTRVQELRIGDLPPGVYTHSGRWLPAEQSLETGRWTAWLGRDDSSPTGLRVERAVTPVEQAPEELDCAAAPGEPFDPTWMAELRCTRDRVVDRPIALEVR